MGNSTSSANNQQNPNHDHPPRVDSPAASSRTRSPSAGGSPHRVHRSLRTKKKSLELPDLASLSLTPANSSPASSPHSQYRRPPASEPIPIPISARPPPAPGFQPQNNLPSAARLAFNNRRRSYNSSRQPSVQSFDTRDPSPPRRAETILEHDELDRIGRPRELIHSTLPIVLIKGDEPGPSDDQPSNISIKWRGGARKVVLARAGDDNWKGRQDMDYDLATNTWSTTVQLLPGTHHFKFLVDDAWRISEEYSKAVDDRDGSLANYVSVTTSSSSQQTTAYPSPLSSPHYNHPNHFNSFWSDNSTAHNQDGDWTTVIPPELSQAAMEEENYLNASSTDSPSSSASVAAPNIPPAPVLPRHLDKLILNVRPSAVTSPSPTGSSNREERDRSRRSGGSRHHRRDRQDRESRGRHLGMMATLEGAEQLGEILPVVTASGADVSGSATPAEGEGGANLTRRVTRLDGPGLADDASVLPVPNHVVLHHLSTSAIRNGVLAVADTTRYRKKYITTIYFKPT